ncbi:hypothetical protein [Caballeronia humi]|uniref:hypothetical protein n=1 Tax=Caballeronia humi TaxID=326474 RepID=UPI000B3E6180|nr:hypothetical protein [Caballeronia humi]
MTHPVHNHRQPPAVASGRAGHAPPHSIHRRTLRAPRRPGERHRLLRKVIDAMETSCAYYSSPVFCTGFTYSGRPVRTLPLSTGATCCSACQARFARHSR